MHIKLVVNSFPSASETFLFNLVTGLERKGHRVSICAMSPSRHLDLYKNRLHEWKGEIEILPFGLKALTKKMKIARSIFSNFGLFINQSRKKGIKKGILSTIKIAGLTKRNPDIIHFAYSGIGVTFLDVMPDILKTNIKLITSCRGSAEKVKPVVDEHRAQQLRDLFSYCHKVHCVSQDMLNGLISYGLDTQKAFVNFPSIDLSYFNRTKPYDASNKEVWKLVTTGRLHFQKGYVYCFNALSILKKKGYKFQYTVLGEGPDKDMLMYLISEMNLKNEIILSGKVSSEKVKDILLDSDVFVLSSLYEGIANAALEAMALQIPLVSTISGGMAEVIETYENGILVNRFSPVEIADALAKLFESQELRQKISNNSREVIEQKFNLENQINVFIKNYSDLIS